MILTVILISDPDDMKKAMRIRHKVFVEEQHVDPELEYEHEDESRHYLALIDAEAAGTARWRRTDKGIKLERFAVLPHYRHRGAAAALLERMLDDIGPQPLIYLHAQESACGLYEKYGFVKEGAAFNEAGIRHYRMRLLP
jgi:predicted GNAT family N-acyltransferase